MSEKWHEAINKELEEMGEKQVWKVIKKEDTSQNRRIKSVCGFSISNKTEFSE
jgi:hypothetical protein